MSNALNDIVIERDRQKQIGTDKNDPISSQNDWIAFVTAYLGRASRGVYRNEREGQEFRTNMVKVGALALAAIEAFDAGYCK